MYQKTAGFYKMDAAKVGRGWHEMGPIRPPSEGRDASLLLRVTRNCPWNRCEFCPTYKNERYSVRTVEEVKADLELVQGLAEELRSASWRLGFAGAVGEEIVLAVINSNPEIYSRQHNDARLVRSRLNSLANVANWLATGAKTVFLQDGNSPQIRTADLVAVLNYIREMFPAVERITSYARSKTIARKSFEEILQLRQAGLSRLHIGLESGCDEVLAAVKKGVTAEEHVMAGKKTKEAGITLSEYLMPGLGGKKWSEKHALDSARVLSEIDPDFIRLRTLIPRRRTPLYERMLAGEFEPLAEDEVVEEIGLFVENLDCHAYLVSDQMSNLLWEVEGLLPEDKPKILATIRNYLQMPLIARLKVQLERRLSSYLAVYGRLEEKVAAKVELAAAAVQKEAPDAPGKVRDALEALKQAFI
ncbi:MAG: radical SAM protein [Bacillota bacterium]